MFKKLFSAFTADVETFSIGQSVSIAEEYHKATRTSQVHTPVYGWTIKSISGNNATILYSGHGNTQKVFIDCKYLRSA